MKLTAYLQFFALCLLSASAWLLDELAPSPLSPSMQLALASGLVYIVAWQAGRRKRLTPVPIRIWLPVLCWSVVLFAFPPMMVLLSAGRLTTTTIALCFTLVPAALSLLLAQSQGADLLRLLGPSLTGVAGACLILPFELPGSNPGRAALAAVIFAALLSALAIVRLCHILRELPLTQSLQCAGLAPAIVGAGSLLSFHPAFPLRVDLQMFFSAALHLLFSGVIFALSVSVLRKLSAAAFGTRFLLVPLITIVEGYLVLRPENTWTLLLGITLIGGAVTMLLRESVFAENPLAHPYSSAIH